MSKSVFKILESLADNITNKGYGIEGLELSYVDTKEKHLEVFTYSSDKYKKAFEEGFAKMGSLLFCEDTFKKKGVIIRDSKFRVITKSPSDNENHVHLVFSHFENPFSNENTKSNPTYSKWMTHYRKSNLNGVFFFYGKRKISDFDLVLFGVIDGQDKAQLKRDVRNLLSKFTDELDDFSMVFERLRESRKEIIEQATRAAISQVMARNTSHNIGAHVMNKLIGDLSKVEIEKFKNYNWGVELYKDEADNNKKLLDQISIFNNYVKCRMDYLADISFGTPLMQTNKYAFGELFTELDKVRLLLENISGLDNWKFEIKFTRNGKPLKSDNDLLVAIPNDILGTQAFYNILENIIRNTAKHAQKKTVKDENGNDKTPKTVFTINFIDAIEIDNKKVVDYCECNNADCPKAHRKEIENALNEFIAVEVYDDIPIEGNPKELSEKELNEYKRMMGDKKPDFEGYIDYLVFSQNSKLNEDILSENSKLRSYSLGLVEMDASAAYLRKRPVEYINHRSYDIQYDESWSRNTEENKKEGRDEINHRGSNCRHFLKAFKKTESDKNYLGYRFFLHRPAVVLVVTELLKDDKEQKEKLKKEGIWIVTKEEFEKHLKPENGKNDGKVYPHEFVVIDSNVKFEKVGETDFLEYYKTSLPIRIINTIKNLSDLLNKNAEEIEKECWEKWETCNEMFIAGSYGSSVTNFQAVFLDHLDSDNPNSNDTPKQKWEKELKADHVEALSSLAQSKMPDFSNHTKEVSEAKVQKYLNEVTKKNLASLPQISYTNVTTYKKIVEAVRTKVIVIDERIQNTTKEPNEGGRDFMTIPYKCLYAKMGVIVPDKSLNLSENSFETIKDKIEKYIEGEIKRAKSTDFILIHYSILERMYEKDKIKTHLDKWAKIINVVVTSGRGTPDNLSGNVRFANLSSVITAFVDVRSKYAINYLLNSSRKSNKI